MRDSLQAGHWWASMLPFADGSCPRRSFAVSTDVLASDSLRDRGETGESDSERAVSRVNAADF